MKIAHISDLHLGKKFFKYDMTPDQDYIFDEIIKIIEKKEIDVLMIAGDVYDKEVQAVEGSRIFRKFLKNLVQRNIRVMIISGNHDSAERLTFGGEFMTSAGIYFSRPYDGSVEKVTLEDKFGPVNFYLLPFINPGMVKRFLNPAENENSESEVKIESYNDAVKFVVENLKINKKERNVIIAHQNILNAVRCESETSIIGGLDAVNADIFDDFEYTALGHIHKPQHIQKNVYFCGTPIKYSIDEFNDTKAMPCITLEEKGKTEIEFEELKPLRDIRKLKGTLAEILEASKNDPYSKEDFIDVVLTNESDLLEPMATIKAVYPNALQINYERENKTLETSLDDFQEVSKTDPMEVFEKFYNYRLQQDMPEEKKIFMQNLITKIWQGASE